MIRYRHDPDHPGAPIVEATPRDLDAYRGTMRAIAHRTWPSLGEADVEDAAQEAMITLCRLVDEGRIRGAYTTTPDVVIRNVAAGVVWRAAATVAGPGRRRGRHVPIGDESGLDMPDPAPGPEDVAEARRLLRQIGRLPPATTRVLLLVVDAEIAEDVARELGLDLSTVYRHVARARDVLAKRYDRPRWSRKRRR